MIKYVCKKCKFKKRAIFVCIFLLNAMFLTAQGVIRTSGTVTDGAGDVLPGVTVIERGTQNGTVTNSDGEYSLSVQPGAMLVFSSVGYTTIERAAVAGIVDVALQEDANLLDELVVVGYGVQRRSDITGAISQIRAADIENRTITRAEQALQGKTAGVQMITTSASPGAAPVIY